jgi:hypothetical protein
MQKKATIRIGGRITATVGGLSISIFSAIAKPLLGIFWVRKTSFKAWKICWEGIRNI